MKYFIGTLKQHHSLQDVKMVEILIMASELRNCVSLRLFADLWYLVGEHPGRVLVGHELHLPSPQAPKS